MSFLTLFRLIRIMLLRGAIIHKWKADIMGLK